MSGPIIAPVRFVDGTQIAVSFDRCDSGLRLRFTGRSESAHTDDVVRAAIRAACRESPARVVVDLNGVADLDASTLGAIVSLRDEAADTVIAIDISRLHGPRLLALLALVLDPGGTVPSRPRAG